MRTADTAKASRIIESAMQLFAERPYHEVRMDDIAARAKVAKGTLYLHFKDKEDLYVGLMSEGLRALGDQIEASLVNEMTPEEKILELTRQAIRYFERNHFFFDLFQRVEILRVGTKTECLEESRARMQGILGRILREFPSRERMSEGDLAVEVVAFSGMMKEVVHSLPRPWPDDLPERITRLFLHGLDGKSAGRKR